MKALYAKLDLFISLFFNDQKYNDKKNQCDTKDLTNKIMVEIVMTKGNNRINSLTNSSGWNSFTTTVTATTPPTFGAGSVIQSYYLQQGNLLLLTLSITGIIAGSSSGNGTYLFNLPSGFTMNSSIVTFPLSYFSLGSVATYAQINGDYGTGIALANDTTHYALMIYSKVGNTINFVSSVFFPTSSGCNYSASLRIPVI